ncbi:efflux transporter outer membrane subunit [bacterium]|nr:efflux transporter outer membrane subunit [bacterium]
MQKHSLRTTGLLLLMIPLLAGCAGRRPVRPAESPPHPEQFQQADSTGTIQAGEWWQAFEDTTLNTLMDDAFGGNLNLAQAAARLDQFRAAYKTSGASQFPSLSVNGSHTQQDALSSNAVVSPFLAAMQPSWSLQLNAAYELDLWGKLSAQRAAAFADLLASENDMRSLMLAVSAQVGRGYYSVIELRQQKELLERTVASYHEYFTLVQERYQRGVVKSVDVYQAEATLAGARAQLALADANLARAEHALSILLGKYPQTGQLPANIDLPSSIEQIPPGLPSDLLKRRPDIAAAQARLTAADRRAAEAVANRFPSINLTGALGNQGADLDAVLNPDNLLWQAIASVSAPIFQGGRLKANAERAEAAWREVNAAYRAALLNAFREVEDALAAGRAQQEYVRQLERESAASEANLRLATEQYLQGITGYLPVVVAQTSTFTSKRNLISARRQLVDTRIQLVTALGGGWMDNEMDALAKREQQSDKEQL